MSSDRNDRHRGNDPARRHGDPGAAARRGARVALRHARRRWPGQLLLMLLVVGSVLSAAWWLARPARPDAFYLAPSEPPTRAGALLRSEPFARALPAGARAWRILYTTTRDPTGTPTVASAIVLVPDAEAPAAPRPVIAWTHGTTGVAPGCAPSLLDEPFAHVPALDQAIAQGWAVVATDYVGLGTQGPHPYLIGEGQARSALDAVRAARELADVRLGTRTVVWGHSQGGHAALWAGILAPQYAPDVGIVGVAAAAPASDLAALVERNAAAPVGRIMGAYVLEAYSAHYPDVRFDDYARLSAQVLARDMASRCLAGRRALFSVGEALLLGGTIFATDPSAGPLGVRLRENTPHHPIATPLLIAQGDADELVLPDVQRAFVATRCAAGQALDYREYAGRDHLTLVAPDSPLTADLIAWTRARFAGEAVPPGCPGGGRGALAPVSGCGRPAGRTAYATTRRPR